MEFLFSRSKEFSWNRHLLSSIRLILAVTLIIVIVSCNGQKEINNRILLVDPGINIPVTKVLLCDKPGPSYHSFDNPWTCTNTGTVPIGTECIATLKQGADLTYYFVVCGSVSGWVNSDFVAFVGP
jgi:hypothetical protein